MSELIDGYDLVIFDLDGVLYLSEEPVAGAPEAVRRLYAGKVPVAYATNNASRLAGQVADLLRRLGMPAEPDEVITSSKAAATVIASRIKPGRPVLVVGAPALEQEIRDVGLTPVRTADEKPDVVVQGYGPQVGWAELAEACVAIRAGASWVATNVDRTLPSPRGPLPGNGSLVAALATALGRQPDTVVGKPAPELYTSTVQTRQSRRPLVVGDRLDTDIEGARRAGMDSLLVLTGVSRAADLLAAPEEQRPTFVAADLGGLFAAGEALGVPAKNWTVKERDGRWELSGAGSAVEALRALAAACWRDGVKPLAADGDPARTALAELGLE